MIRIIGNGGHAKVVREVIAKTEPHVADTLFIAIGDNLIRKAEAESRPAEYSILVHPSATVANDVAMGSGTVIMAGAVIQPGARIGKHCIVNTGATVDHDCILEDYVHIAPGAHLCGSVHVGEGALVGVGACAVPGARIASWSLVKALTLAK